MKTFSGPNEGTAQNCFKCNALFTSLQKLKYCECCEDKIGYQVLNPIRPASAKKYHKCCWECGLVENLIPYDLGGWICKDCE